MHTRRPAKLVVALSAAFLALAGLPALPAHAVASVPADFDHDGRSDLVIKVPEEDFSGRSDAGIVHVLPGSASGATAAGDQRWSQDSAGVLGGAEADDMFGYRWAECDFDGDGFDDLAIGSVGEGVSGHAGAGAVSVMYGGAGGLSPAADQYWTQDSPGVRQAAEDGDGFGTALAAGDFDGDGRCDLAIGASTETFGGMTFAGVVQVLYGSASGLSATGNQTWTQDSTGILDDAEAFQMFGTALAAGDFNDDGKDDLAIGVPRENPSGVAGAGAVTIIFGSLAGLSSAGNHFWSQDTVLVTDSAEAGDAFGVSLAVGDFDGDGAEDLAVGVYHEETGAQADAGAVAILRGGVAGPVTAGNVLITQETSGVPGADWADDEFGTALAAGDFNGDGLDDLAVGAPYENLVTDDEGAVTVLKGGGSPILSGGATQWSQATPSVADSSETDDYFGDSLHTGDFNGDGKDDLAVAVPAEDLSGKANVGALHVLLGGATGLTATGSQFWNQDSPGVMDSIQAHDAFGSVI